MPESFFLADGAGFAPTELTRGPWDPRALHGGAPAALITSAFERMQPGGELLIARLGFEFLRPVPLAPLTLTTRIVRPGRRVQELAGELRARDGGEDGELVCRASALRVQAIDPAIRAEGADGEPDGRPASDRGGTREPPMGSPAQAKSLPFSLDGSSEASFASSMEMRALEEWRTAGPARVWMRPRHRLLGEEQLTPLSRLAACADFGNGVSAALPFERYLFINADLTIHLRRRPRGEWIGLDARTSLAPGGSGLAESVLHDLDGPVGRAFQTLVVQARS